MMKKITKLLVVLLVVFGAYSFERISTVYAISPGATEVKIVPQSGSALITGRVNEDTLLYLAAHTETTLFVRAKAGLFESYEHNFTAASDGSFRTTMSGLPKNNYEGTINISSLGGSGGHSTETVLSNPIPFTVVVSAGDPGNAVFAPEITTSSEGGNVVISGTVSNQVKKDYLSRSVTADATITLVYAAYLGDGTDTAEKPKKVNCSEIAYDSSFKCSLRGLAKGEYYYRVVVDDSGTLSHRSDPATAEQMLKDASPVWFGLFSGGRKFTITSVNAGDTVSVSFGSFSAVTEHQMDATTTAGGYDFTVTMNVTHLAKPTKMYVQLGTATQVGNSSNYICTAAPQRSPDQLVEATIKDTARSVGFALKKVPDGNYCVRTQIDLSASGGFIPITATTGDKMDEGGFFTTYGSIIHVGNAAPLAPGATNDPLANMTGCVTNNDNSNYCMLAPLPGYGDGTGNFDVTKGVGEYFMLIVRIVMGLIGILSVIMITVGGIEYMTTVSIGEKEGAKSRITSALLGLLLALSSYVILRTLNPKLVNIDVTIPQVEVSISTDMNDPTNAYEPTAGTGVNEPSGGSTTPGLLTNKNLKKYDTALQKASAAKGVDCTLAKAIMAQESNFSATRSDGSIIMSTYTDNKGHVGHAYGLMQLLPGTFSAYGGTGSYSDATNTVGNINAGVGFIAALQTSACRLSGTSSCTTSDKSYIIAAYNGGFKANKPSKDKQCVGKTLWECPANWTPNANSYRQTHNYVLTVLANYKALKESGNGC